ncbi:MAG: FAD-binding oxidoreductase [Sphingomonas bacterium]|jgi:4-cresol dehydrogenase (hydroxylating)|nr:FAD-binding oxidoreductase [Sphingomonas bacterium]
MDVVYPPGLSPAALDRALKAFGRVVGPDAVFATEEDRQDYSDKFAIDDAAHQPLGGVAPASAAEVQAIVRVANEHRVPIWPISRGKNLGYGATAPRLSGTVVVDMSRMKKIEVDVENGTALLEPGVGFYDLYDHLQANKIPLWLSVPGNSWGSVIGNALDRGVGYTPYGENTTKLCGMEVVLPDGDIVRTGMGALAGSPTWQLYRYGFGPAWDQMFVQSNFGIVTKAGMWLMPEPEQVRGLDVEVDRIEDLAPLIDAIGALRREGVLQQSPTIGNWLRAANIVSTRQEWTDKKGALSDDVISAIRKKFGLGWWGVSLRLYGRESVTNATFPILEQAMRALKPLSMKPTLWRRGDPIPPTQGGWMGVPMTFPMQNANWYGGRGGHIGFSPILPQSGKLALEQFRRAYARYQEFGMDPQTSFAFGERHLINVNAVLLDKDDPAFMKRVDPFLRALIADAKAHGYGEYRTHLDYMDAVAGTYDFNDHALRRLNEKVKNALDPAGILAPGKSGIWPAAYAKERGK